MARYIREEYINKPQEFVDFIMKDFLTKHQFEQNNLDGEMIWQDGVGMLSMPRFFKYYYMNGVIHLEAWTRTAWFPGIYGKKENDLSGFYGSLPKQAYRNDIDNLIQVLYQPLPSDQQYGQNPYYNQNGGYNQPVMNQNGYYNHQPNGPIVVKGVDNKNLATTGFIFSLIGVPVGFLNGFLGLVLACIGTAYSHKSRHSSKAGLANAGFVIGIIGIVISSLWILWQFFGDAFI